MNAAERWGFFKRVVLAVWGMLTVVLLCCIVLLVVEMIRQKQDPLDLAKKAVNEPLPLIAATEELAPKKEISLFFADAGAHGLVPETGTIEFSDFTVENCRNALEALIQGPQTSLTAILPSNTKIRGLYLLKNGELVVDFSMELEFEVKKIQSASLEALMFYGITQTLTQAGVKGEKEPAVTKVRFLIEGTTPHESFPGHIDVTAPIAADPQWVARAKSAGPAGSTSSGQG